MPRIVGLEIAEGCPTAVFFGGVFEVVGEIYEEIQTRLCLNLVDAHCVSCVVGSLGAHNVFVVLLVLKPETDGGCAVATDFEHHFVVVVGHGHFRAVTAVGYLGYALLAIYGLEYGTRRDVYGVAVVLHLCANGIFEVLPNAAIKTVLNLWC